MIDKPTLMGGLRCKQGVSNFMYIGRGCSKERVRSAVIKMIEAKFKLELLTQKSFYDVIEEPLKVKIMGEKLKNFVIFSSKKCDVFDFKSVTV